MPKQSPPEKPEPGPKLKRNKSHVNSVQANAFFAKYGPNAKSNDSNTITKPKIPSMVMVSESEDELLLRSPKEKKRKEKKKDTVRQTYSLEESQASSPPSRPSSSVKKVIGSRSKGGPGPSSLKNAKSSYGVFSGTVNKFPRAPVHDSSAISRQSSLTTPVPKSSTTLGPKSSSTTSGPKSKVNPSRPTDTTKKSGLEAIKQTMRKPAKVEISAAQLQFERDYGPTLEPVLSKEEMKRNEEHEAEKVLALELLRNHRQTVEIDLRPRPIVVAEKEAPEMIIDLDDEFAEEELTEEEKEYLKGFCDLDDLCLLCKEPLPLDYNPSLHRQGVKLAKQIRQRGKDSISYDQRFDFCNTHKYLTQIIPLGRRAGYPETIAWLDLWKDMEIPWIRRRIEMMVKRPMTSPMFRYYYSDEDQGESEWARYFANARSSDIVGAGYYGDVGSEIIKAYIYELTEWEYLPLFDQTARYKPLGPQEFVTKVLVPEIAIMLIQLRQIQLHQGLQPEGNTTLEDEAYTKAQEIRKKSMVYGKVAYYEMDSQIPGEIMMDWHNAGTVESRRNEVARMRGIKRRAKATIVDLTEEENQEGNKTLEDLRGPSSQSLKVYKDELDDSDIETIKLSQRSFNSSSSRSNFDPDVEISPALGSPVRTESDTPEPVPTHTRKRIESQIPTESESGTPLNSQTSQTTSTTSTPGRGRCRKRRKGEILAGTESQSVSMSQESFGDFDFPSQEFDRLDALVAAL